MEVEVLRRGLNLGGRGSGFEVISTGSGCTTPESCSGDGDEGEGDFTCSEGDEMESVGEDGEDREFEAEREGEGEQSARGEGATRLMTKRMRLPSASCFCRSGSSVSSSYSRLSAVSRQRPRETFRDIPSPPPTHTHHTKISLLYVWRKSARWRVPTPVSGLTSERMRTLGSQLSFRAAERRISATVMFEDISIDHESALSA
jgi:hypothetical protein